MNRTLFITGIDTDAGKTYATAFLANMLRNEGKTVITQKFIQTGCNGSSEDIEKHRLLCGQNPLPEDVDGTTAPIIYTYPASAQLAAQIDGREIDLSQVEKSTNKLLEKYDVVLIEGAGGLMVPVDDHTFTVDYIASHHLPAVLVTNARLGSINHTVLSLEALKNRGIKVHTVVFNHHFDIDPIIAADTLRFVKQYIKREFPEARLVEMSSFAKLC